MPVPRDVHLPQHVCLQHYRQVATLPLQRHSNMRHAADGLVLFPQTASACVSTPHVLPDVLPTRPASRTTRVTATLVSPSSFSRPDQRRSHALAYRRRPSFCYPFLLSKSRSLEMLKLGTCAKSSVVLARGSNLSPFQLCNGEYFEVK